MVFVIICDYSWYLWFPKSEKCPWCVCDHKHVGIPASTCFNGTLPWNGNQLSNVGCRGAARSNREPCSIKFAKNIWHTYWVTTCLQGPGVSSRDGLLSHLGHLWLVVYSRTALDSEVGESLLLHTPFAPRWEERRGMDGEFIPRQWKKYFPQHMFGTWRDNWMLQICDSSIAIFLFNHNSREILPLLHDFNLSKTLIILTHAFLFQKSAGLWAKHMNFCLANQVAEVHVNELPRQKI